MNNKKGLDFKKLDELSPKIQKQAIIEELNDIPSSFLEFTNNDISNYSLNETKTRITADVSPRVLNNWIQKGVISVDSSDKGKINRFNRLESIWLKIVVDLRSFGLPLEALKYIREQLFSYVVGDFFLFKFKVLHAILSKPEYFVIDDKYKIGFYSNERYSKLALKGWLLPHLSLRFSDYINKEFPKNSLHINFNIEDIENDVEKVSLLYYLKTNDFIEMRITLNDGDTRLLLDSSELLKNKLLLKQIECWGFRSISVKINDNAEFMINN